MIAIIEPKHRTPVDISNWRVNGYEWLNPGDLLVADYQRKVSSPKINSLAKNFDINKVGTLIVSLRDDMRYYLIDGQHRSSAALRRGVPLLPCQIFVGLKEAEEAELRMALNIRKPDTVADVFVLKLRAEDQSALKIREIVESSGLTLHLQGRASGMAHQNPRVIGCIGAMEYVHAFGRGDMLRDVLWVSCAAWPDEQQGRAAVVIRGLHVFLAKYPEVDKVKLIAKLQMHPPSSLCRAVRARMNDALETGHHSTHFARVILMQYNQGRRNNRLPNRF